MLRRYIMHKRDYNARCSTKKSTGDTFWPRDCYDIAAGEPQRIQENLTAYNGDLTGSIKPSCNELELHAKQKKIKKCEPKNRRKEAFTNLNAQIATRRFLLLVLLYITSERAAQKYFQRRTYPPYTTARGTRRTAQAAA